MNERIIGRDPFTGAFDTGCTPTPSMAGASVMSNDPAAVVYPPGRPPLFQHTCISLFSRRPFSSTRVVMRFVTDHWIPAPLGSIRKIGGEPLASSGTDMRKVNAGSPD